MKTSFSALWITRSGLRQVSLPVASEGELEAVIAHAAPRGLLGAMRLRRQGERLEWWCALSGLWRRVVDWSGAPSTSPLDAPVWLPHRNHPKRRGGRQATSTPFEIHAQTGNPWAERRRA